MSKASDIIEPVINDLLSDITDTVNENNTTPNISTMNEPSETNNTELDVLIQQLQEERRQLEYQIDEILKRQKRLTLKRASTSEISEPRKEKSHKTLQKP